MKVDHGLIQRVQIGPANGSGIRLQEAFSGRSAEPLQKEIAALLRWAGHVFRALAHGADHVVERAHQPRHVAQGARFASALFHGA